ncbi:MAG: Fe-S oxidoreductase, partial [Chitinophagaceae bacterium]
MQYLPQALFILLALVSVVFFTMNAKKIRQNILAGRDETINDEKGKRWKNVLLLAFGQKKMFKNPLVAVLHFVVYAGFVIINIEVLEIALDGVFGTHRLFFKPLGDLYIGLING